MPRSQYGPAAGTNQGAAPRLAAIHVPDFLRLDRGELHCVLAQLRDPLVTHVYLVLLGNAVFQTGEFLGTYARLMDLCTPPAPEKGRRRPGPTYEQLRRSINDLVAIGLVVRADTNEAQGQLRLYVPPRGKEAKSKATPKGSGHRV